MQYYFCIWMSAFFADSVHDCKRVLHNCVHMIGPLMQLFYIYIILFTFIQGLQTSIMPVPHLTFICNRA